jgi:hypothetical protein
MALRDLLMVLFKMRTHQAHVLGVCHMELLQDVQALQLRRVVHARRVGPPLHSIVLHHNADAVRVGPAHLCVGVFLHLSADHRVRPPAFQRFVEHCIPHIKLL